MRYTAVRDDTRGGYQIHDNVKDKAVMGKPYNTPQAAQAAAKKMNEEFSKEDAKRAKAEIKKKSRKPMKKRGMVSGVDVEDVKLTPSRFDDPPPQDKD